jgi:hypothetical protein
VSFKIDLVEELEVTSLLKQLILNHVEINIEVVANP